MEIYILGLRIKQLREEKNISQLDFAKILNISNTTLSQYESGKRVPSDEIKLKISDFFNVSIDYLLGKTNIKEPADKILEKAQDTIALHRNDGYEDDLPEEARKEIEDFKEYVRHKYGKKK